LLVFNGNMNNNLFSNEILFFKINRWSTQNDHEDSRNITLNEVPYICSEWHNVSQRLKIIMEYHEFEGICQLLSDAQKKRSRNWPLRIKGFFIYDSLKFLCQTHQCVLGYYSPIFWRFIVLKALNWKITKISLH
jgi:hypothetical protein